ncbi:alpha/beta fold hydrolase [Sphingomonas sp.]|uniref:alpha/beta fold hydrolase n=1 Tax=Sphingomonas sp. TaxID=28214 RepID=UPI002DD66EDC|nr:alpha/beta hydrolase [Sphingomonas sp.]
MTVRAADPSSLAAASVGWPDQSALDIREHHVFANGIRQHVIEAGAGPAVLLCHGFPESWYSWRHQIVALASAGYRVIAPDMRGYGSTDAPEAIDAYTLLHLVGDMTRLLAAMGVDRAVVVGHDWGAPVAHNCALLRPDLFVAMATLSIPYVPRGDVSVVEAGRRAGMDDFYQLYFQRPGTAEANMDRDVAATLSRLIWNWSGSPGKGRQWLGVVRDGDLVGSLEPAGDHQWMTSLDLDFYVAAYRARGFRAPLNWYRNLDRNWELLAPFHGMPLSVPVLFVTGTEDPVLQWRRSAVENMRDVAPRLTDTLLIDGAGHWVQQEAPEAVNAALIAFLRECGW